MKAYTDIEQSKKLAEILPLESADMGWNVFVDGTTRILPINDWDLVKDGSGNVKFYPAWSLAALYSVLPTFTLDSSDDKYFRIHCCNKFSEWYNNPIDATFEIILKLKEMNLL